MTLPKNFQFSQGSLQDFADCPRRFQLKYIEQLAWPAVEAEPALENENFLQQGATFHRLAQQYLLGVETEKLAAIAEQNVNLAQWWENFIGEIGKLANRETGNYYPEISLSAPLGEFRIVGKYDLLTIADDKFIIYDWKTSRKQPKRAWIAANLQTRVYPFLLTEAGAYLNHGKPIDPSQIEMVYWFANFPAAPLKFTYSPQQCQEDQADIESLIAATTILDASPAEMTSNEKRCRYCVYRSLCNRGVAAGPYEDLEDAETQEPLNFELNFEQIAEIEF